MTGPLDVLALAKLRRILGDEKGAACHREAMASLEVGELATPQDLLDFGRALERRGGMAAAVGTLLIVQAVLRGARDD